MSDERQQKKKKSRVIVRDESCRQLESSGATPDVSVSPFGQIPPLCVRLLEVVKT